MSSPPAGLDLISGVVVDSVTGEPVSGGRVSAHARDLPQREEGVLVDDVRIKLDGTFRLALESTPIDHAAPHVRVPGHVGASCSARGGASAAHELRIEVERHVRLSGTVRRPDGTPLAGGRVRLLPSQERVDLDVDSRTGKDGSFLLELPSGEVGRAGLVFEHRGRRYPLGRMPGLLAGAEPGIVRDYQVNAPAADGGR